MGSKSAGLHSECHYFKILEWDKHVEISKKKNGTELWPYK